MASDSETAFHRTLQFHTENARSELQKCVVAFLAYSNTERVASANAAKEAVGRLRAMLAPADYPHWLSPLHEALDYVQANHANAPAILSMQKVCNEYQPLLNLHQWKIGSKDANAFDFEAIYIKYRDENKIPELFDKMIHALEEIGKCEALDSRMVLDQLERVVATLKKARESSLSTTDQAIAFAAAWIKNTLWELGSEVPALGVVVRGLRQTVDDTKAAMDRMTSQIEKETREETARRFPKIERLLLSPPNQDAAIPPRLEYTPKADE